MAADENYRILDGGLATELMVTHQRTDFAGDPLWSAKLIKSHSDAIKQVHTSYLKAGADLIETATYQASIKGFMTHLCVQHDEAVDLIRRSVDVCKLATDEFWRDAENRAGRIRPLVVGSLGPYGAHLADCSEYNGNYVDTVSIEELIEWHRPQTKALLDAGVDMIAFETVPALKETRALVQLLREFPSCKAWISFVCENGQNICHGEPISEAANIAAASDQVVAVGINCTSPCYVSDLLSNIPDSVKYKKSVVVYPNSGEDWLDNGIPCGRTDVIRFDNYVGDWMKLGAKWIGGCCCVTPADISLIRSSVLNRLSSSHVVS